MTLVNYDDINDLPPVDYDQSKVPPRVKERADGVREAVLGKQNKEFIAQGIELISLTAREALEAQAYDGNSLADVTLAKDGLPTLDARIKRDVNNLENKKADKAEVSAQLAQKANLSDIGAPTQEQVNAWLEANPDATTTVADGAITNRKLAIGAVTPNRTSFINSKENLFDKDSADLVTGHILNNSGTPVVYVNGVISHKVYVHPGDTFTTNIWSSSFGGANRIHYYDNTDTLVVSSTSFADAVYTFTVPDNPSITYIKFNVHKNSLNNAMMVRGTELPTEYLPFGEVLSLNESLYLNETMKTEVEDMIVNRSTAIRNPLYGKKAAWNGDSIMHASTASKGGFAKVISDRNAMIYDNRGRNGATITAGTTISTGENRRWLCRDVDNMLIDADYIIFDGGVNDGSLGVPLGEISTGYTDELDDLTYCGALESLIKAVYQRYPGKKFGFIQVHKMTASQEKYVPITIQILEKWGVPYINLYELVPPLGYIEHLRTAYTNNSDGWHPNDAGYHAFYTDKIESWMRTL